MSLRLPSSDVRRLHEALRITSFYDFPATFAPAGDVAAETAARIAADTVLQNQITALQQPVYAPQMLLGGM